MTSTAEDTEYAKVLKVLSMTPSERAAARGDGNDNGRTRANLEAGRLRETAQQRAQRQRESNRQGWTLYHEYQERTHRSIADKHARPEQIFLDWGIGDLGTMQHRS